MDKWHHLWLFELKICLQDYYYYYYYYFYCYNPHYYHCCYFWFYCKREIFQRSDVLLLFVYVLRITCAASDRTNVDFTSGLIVLRHCFLFRTSHLQFLISHRFITIKNYWQHNCFDTSFKVAIILVYQVKHMRIMQHMICFDVCISHIGYNFALDCS